jgi:small GTP-binding protein
MSCLKPKVVLLGNTSTGKTSFANRVKYGYFMGDMSSTIGCEFFGLDYMSKTPGMPEVKWSIWDTAGQEIFRSFTPQFCRGASLALIFYDITDPKTAESVGEWIEMLDNQDPTGTMCEVIVVPTKSDLYEGKLDEDLFMVATSEKRPVYNARPISSKKDINIDVLLEQMVRITSRRFPQCIDSHPNILEKTPNPQSRLGYVEVVPIYKKCCGI